ncbi:hypothetical protein FACS189472_17780 [Alphaproteobacteria bacterium]|nr:hypothetical protein FACS189472_17780 [Alphaproteobacteria bacterium]
MGSLEEAFSGEKSKDVCGDTCNCENRLEEPQRKGEDDEDVRDNK